MTGRILSVYTITMKTLDDTVGAQLRSLRLRHGWFVTEVAKKVGVSRIHMSMCEHGRRVPGRKLLEKLADLYGVSVARLWQKVRNAPEGS